MDIANSFRDNLLGADEPEKMAAADGESVYQLDAQNYCWLNFGTGGNTQCAIEQISDKGKILTATRLGSVDTGKWYGVKLTVAGDNVKAWLDDELIFDEMLKPLR